MHANSKGEWAHTVALGNKVNMATLEIQNMKSFMQTMAELVQAMQSMMMSNPADGLVATGSVVGETSKKWSWRGPW